MFQKKKKKKKIIIIISYFRLFKIPIYLILCYATIIHRKTMFCLSSYSKVCQCFEINIKVNKATGKPAKWYNIWFVILKIARNMNERSSAINLHWFLTFESHSAHFPPSKNKILHLNARLESRTLKNLMTWLL